MHVRRINPREPTSGLSETHRYERKADHFHAFADLGYALLCYRRLTKNNHLE
ncbi:hypothetical protein ACQPWW_12735 [Micromonospora sp. CA-240977]|uniref:hypothetical protein n=1 Tax=Micromonospora sp. CA-240977 TaxID=3239957 RepID=UPI003D8F8E19